MPLGDSITRGLSGDPSRDGYRKPLFDSLRGMSYNVRFVGSETLGTIPPPDNRHEGHSGWTSGDIAGSVHGFLTANPADIILLHIGTNDVSLDMTSAAGVENILDEIDRYSTDTWVVLARIANRSPLSADTTTYNDNLQAAAQARIDGGDKILLVDMENGADLVYAPTPAGDLASDGLHPYVTGYAKMAQVWKEALVDLLPACGLPQPGDDSYTVDEDSASVNLDVMANDSGGALSIVSVTAGSHGGTTSQDSLKVTYRPAANFSGTETFTYTVNNGDPASTGAALVTMTVRPINDPPNAVDDSLSVVEDSQANVLDVLANDSILPDTGESLTITSVGSGSAGGSLTTDGGLVYYTPKANFFGLEIFYYTISDGAPGSSDTAQASVEVTPLNDPPTANDDQYSVFKNSPAALLNVLANDSILPDSGETLAVVAVSAGSAGGSLSISGGQVSYAPALNFIGQETFTYTLGDGTPGSSDTARVTVDVLPINEPPQLNDDFREATEDSPLTIAASSLTANDSPGAGEGSQGLSVAGVQSTADTHGAVSLLGGQVLYTPAKDFNGPASFQYTACDTGSPIQCGAASVLVDVAAVNDPPVPASDQRNMLEDHLLSFSEQVLRANDTPGPADEGGQSLEITAVSGSPSTYGAVSLEAGAVRYQPEADYNGPAEFVYTVCDNGSPELCAAGVVVVTVVPINDAPSFVKGPDVEAVVNSGAVSLPAWAGAISPGPADEGGQALDFLVSNDNPLLFVDQPAIHPQSGDLSFTLKPEEVGKATFTILLQDDGGTADGGSDTSEPQTITLTIHPINQPPGGIELSRNILEEQKPGGTIVGEFSTMDPDEGDTFQYSLIKNEAFPDNHYFVIEGNALKTKAVLDYETRKSFSIRVRTTDWDGLFWEAVFKIDLLDVDEPPVILPPGILKTAELEEISFQIQASDPEGQPLTYLPVELPSWLDIDAHSGIIHGAAPRGSAKSWTLRVAVLDQRYRVEVEINCLITGSEYTVFLPSILAGR